MKHKLYGHTLASTRLRSRICTRSSSTTSNPVPVDVDDGDTVLFIALQVAILLALASYDRGLNCPALTLAMREMALRSVRAFALIFGCFDNYKSGSREHRVFHTRCAYDVIGRDLFSPTTTNPSTSVKFCPVATNIISNLATYQNRCELVRLVDKVLRLMDNI